MKNLIYLSVVSLIMYSCEPKEIVEPENPCDGVVCLNAGYCLNGVCVCETGYMGEDCSEVDPCAFVDCNSNGICINGTCECEPGYEGLNCENAVNEKFEGTYLAYDACNLTGNKSYTLTITKESTLTGIQINNLGDFFSSTSIGVVDGNDFTVERQSPDNDAFYLEGNGEYDEQINGIRFSYVIRNEANSLIIIDSCTAIWTKQ